MIKKYTLQYLTVNSTVYGKQCISYTFYSTYNIYGKQYFTVKLQESQLPGDNYQM